MKKEIHFLAFNRHILALVSILTLLKIQGSEVSSVNLLWEPNPNPNVFGQVVYYGTESGQYTKSMTVDAKTSSVTLDGLEVETNYYAAISSFDQIGHHSRLSNEVCFSSAIQFIRLANESSSISQQEIHVAWEPSPSPNVQGYLFYYGTESRGYTHVAKISGSKSSITLTNLEEGKGYYCTVAAFDDQGRQSDFSNEILVEVSAAPHTNKKQSSSSSMSLSSILPSHLDWNEKNNKHQYPVTDTDANQRLSSNTVQIANARIQWAHRDGYLEPVVWAPHGMVVMVEMTTTPSDPDSWVLLREMDFSQGHVPLNAYGEQSSVVDSLKSILVPVSKTLDLPWRDLGDQAFFRIKAKEDAFVLIQQKLAGIVKETMSVDVQFSDGAILRFIHCPVQGRSLMVRHSQAHIILEEMDATIAELTQVFAQRYKSTISSVCVYDKHGVILNGVPQSKVEHFVKYTIE